MTDPRWRKSTHSGQQGSCVEVTEHDDHIAVRNTKHPDAGTLYFTRAEMAAWIARCRAGEFDDLA
jgi:hypothetical protein